MAPRRASRYMRSVRTVVYQYDDLRRLADALDAARGHALPLPQGVRVEDGEWVLAMFELAGSRRATAAAARGAVDDQGPAIVFERRDWERLGEFAAAAPRDSLSTDPNIRITVDLGDSGERPTAPRDSVPASERRVTSYGAAPRHEVAPRPRTGAVRAEAGVSGKTASYEVASRSVGALERSGGPPTIRDLGSVHDFDAADDDDDIDVREPSETTPPLRRAAPIEATGRVFLLDEDPDLRDVVGAMLEAVGLTVTPFGSATEALAALDSAGADLLLLDTALPGMSGLEVCRLIRRDPRHFALPVLFLTANGGTQEMVEAFAAGADDFVLKPFRAAELGARIFGLLRRAHALPLRSP